jgi:hypothetical protein
MSLLFEQELATAECPVIRDERAIKGKVIKCVKEKEFLAHKQTEVGSSSIDWERMTQYATFRNGLVLTIQVTYKRGFTFACERFLANEISEPI